MKKYIVSYVVIFIMIAILNITKGFPMSISISESHKFSPSIHTSTYFSTELLPGNLIISYALLVYSLIITFKKNNSTKGKNIILIIILLAICCYIPLTKYTQEMWAAAHTVHTHYDSLVASLLRGLNI